MSAAFVAAARTRGRGFGYNYGNRGRSYLDEDDAGPNMCWLAIFGMIGIALFGSGAWYAYDSFDDPRNMALKPYNKAVEAWNTVHRPEFADTTFEWRVVSPTTQTVTVSDANGKTHDEVQSVKAVDPAASTAAWMPMDQAMVPEPLARDQNREGILQYEPLRWLARGILPAQPAGQLDRGPDGIAFWTGPDYKVQLRARDKDGKESVFDLEPIVPMKEVSVPANQKMCRMHHNNNFHNQRCWDKMAISSACLRLNHTSDGWKAPEGMQRGCAAGAELSFGHNCPGSNTAGHGLSSNPKCDFSNVTLTVRSMDDPHIIAQILTAGTLNFGYTPHENWVTGIVMMCIGGLFLCPIAFMCCSWLAQKRSRHSEYLKNDSIFVPKQYDRTTTKSPSPSVSSGATDDDYRIDMQNSRTSSLSPRRRRTNDKDAAPFGAAPATGYYGVQPGGQVPVGVDIEMQGVAAMAINMDPPAQDWRARARAYAHPSPLR